MTEWDDWQQSIFEDLGLEDDFDEDVPEDAEYEDVLYPTRMSPPIGNIPATGRQRDVKQHGGDDWRCETCTFANAALQLTCSMCNTKRPSNGLADLNEDYGEPLLLNHYSGPGCC